MDSIATAAPAALLDLRDWDGSSTIPLKGPWEFYWGNFIEPGQKLRPPDALLEAGRPWNGTVLVDGSKLGSFGYASYRLRIRNLPPRASGYEFVLRFANTAFTVFVFADHQKIPLAQASSGDPKAKVQQRSGRLIHLPISAHGNPDIEIIIWISNSISHDGGIWSTPELAPFGKASSLVQLEGFINLISCGILLATGIYCFMLWWRRREDSPALFLSLAAVSGVLRIISTTPWILAFFPDFLYQTLYRFEYGSIPFGICCYFYFLHAIYGRHLKQWIRQVVTVVAFLLCTHSLLSPVYYLSWAISIYQIYAVACTLLFIGLIGGAIQRHEDGMIPTSVGCLLIILGCAYDIGVAAPALLGNSVYVTPIAGALFLILQAQVIAKRSAHAYARAEAYARDIESLNQNLIEEVEQRKELNASLEIKVAERTGEIRSLLQHIPQGILTIGDGGVIGSNYSMHLHGMLQLADIAGRSFKEVVLDPSRLSPNAIDQAWQTILASIGEDVLNFEMNADNLPTEFSYQGEDEIVLRCTWNVERDRRNIVQRILVTLMDVTAEVESQRKLEAKNKEFQIVRQLVDIGPNKSRQFFASSLELLSENVRLMAAPTLDLETIKILFINIHTLKGSARTLQLTEISNILHEVENAFVAILRHGAAIHRERLENDLSRVLAIFQQYDTVHCNILGRSEDEGKILIEREFLEQHFHLVQHLTQEGMIPSRLRQLILDNCDELVKLIFMSLPAVLEDIFQQAARMARDLDKMEPVLSMSVNGILISHRQEMTLRNCFVHLLRNSLDHGIEGPDERLAKGKAARGSIRVRAQEKDSQIIIHYEDDGAGLAIGHLREKGLEKGLIRPVASLQEIADLVFHQGMSTSKAVSMISGRGVGMDAVRRFLEGEGGHVQLCLGDRIDPDREYYRFQFILYLPSHRDRLHALAVSA